MFTIGGCCQINMRLLYHVLFASFEHRCCDMAGAVLGPLAAAVLHLVLALVQAVLGTSNQPEPAKERDQLLLLLTYAVNFRTSLQNEMEWKSRHGSIVLITLIFLTTYTASMVISERFLSVDLLSYVLVKVGAGSTRVFCRKSCS